ncbi:uncharacterized protein BJ212DRAFT_1299153 [Suillus subaureus]|uniref:Uncharacterized protein n=1 Tax=Suillus subaureus TaxID=48587 RepID=A0A9P7EDF1_9AGAM|nr:uncharacterized protein BJ212DRAFT_1299153 [Suillus subaureus]KAG1817623.1 hypothetical protein BJ212DRAFT_1299153 [Suillus subaureus]
MSHLASPKRRLQGLVIKEILPEDGQGNCFLHACLHYTKSSVRQRQVAQPVAMSIEHPVFLTAGFFAPWTNHLVSRAVLQPHFTELEASRWEDETMSVLLCKDPGMLGPKTWYQDHHELHWAKLPDESLCRAYIQFSLMKMCHQQEAMKVLLQGVAEGLILQGLLLTMCDQLFEDDTPLETIDAEELMSDWSHGAEECCIRWKSTSWPRNMVCQKLEAPAITTLQEMRKWTHNLCADRKSAMELVILVNTTSFMSIVFAFSSERCFLAEAVRWMLLTLAAKVPSVTWIYKASLNQLFCLICGFSNANLDALHLDEELLLVLKSSAKLRGLHKELAKGFHKKFHKNVDPSTQGCHTCYHQAKDSKLSCLILPMILINFCPREGLRKISRHADVLACCGQDITLLVDASSPNTMLAGVSFDTLSYEDLQKIRYESSAGKETKAIKQGSQFCRFEWGKMHPVGSRKPTGGKPGDTYMGYAGMEVMDTSHIRLLFTHTAHVDHDATWTIALQTYKEAMADEFNFVMMDLGCYVETAENALWWFQGGHTHGTVVPQLSSMLSNRNLSQGIGVTLPKTSFQAAQTQSSAHDAFEALAQKWQVDIK